MLWPNSSTSSSAVSWSIVWLTVTIMPILKSAFTRSAPFSAMRLASSCTVIASGTTTSRACFSRGWFCPAKWARRSFSRARLSAASERARAPSSSLNAVLTDSLPPRRFSSRSALRFSVPPRLGFFSSRFFSGRLTSGRATGVKRRGAGDGVVPLPCASASSATGSAASGSAGAGAGAGASASALRFSSARRFSSSRARAFSSSSRRRASSASRRRSSSASRCRRATRSCGVSAAGAGARLGVGFGAGGGGGAGSGAGAGAAASPGLPSTRRRLTSTTTLLVRPWLKVCLTSPASSERLRPSGLRVRGVSSLSLI